MGLRATETRHPASPGLHKRAAKDVLSDLLDAQVAALRALAPALPVLALIAEAGAEVLARGGKLGYAGAGSSGLMALADALEIPGTFGIPPDRVPVMFAGGAAALLHMTGAVEDDPSLAQADLDASGLEAGDMVLVLSASGTTPYALVIADRAKARGIKVAGLANVPGSPLLQRADLSAVLETGPEVVSGSTRMGAGTAQKAALNMLSTLIGIRLGHVHDGYMVNVVADNAKLIDRATRIVADIAQVSRATAEAALTASRGDVKTAVLVAKGCSPNEASDRLTKAGGHLALAL